MPTAERTPTRPVPVELQTLGEMRTQTRELRALQGLFHRTPIWEQTHVAFRPAAAPAGVVQIQTRLPGTDEIEIEAWCSSAAAQPAIIVPGKQDAPSIPASAQEINALLSIPPNGSPVSRRVYAIDVQWVTVYWPLAAAAASPDFVTVKLRAAR